MLNCLEVTMYTACTYKLKRKPLFDGLGLCVLNIFLVSLMDLIQKYNIFEFHDGQLWKQLYGVAMGIHPAPSFANNYLARRLDNIIRELSQKYGENNESAFKIFKRFLDDLFQIFIGTTKQLHQLN